MATSEFVHAISGCSGGMLALALFYPLDQLRTRIQLADVKYQMNRKNKGIKKRGNGCVPRSESIIRQIRMIFQNEGIHGLYKGCYSVICTLGTSYFIYFYIYNYIKRILAGSKSVSTTQNSEYITHGGSPSSTIEINQEVSGTGIPANTKIVTIDNPNRFEISNVATATGNIDLTITTTTFNYVPQCLVYTMPKNRWDVWNRVNSDISTDFNTHGAIYGKNNELLVSDTDNGLVQPFDPKSSTRVNNFKWYSKKFTMGESTTDKKLYKF